MKRAEFGGDGDGDGEKNQKRTTKDSVGVIYRTEPVW